MKVIQPNCRVQFTAEDVAFITSVLGASQETLIALLTDPESLDLILDDESLYRALLEHRGCLRVSAHFYFYVLARHVLKNSGLQDRTVADYVAELLTEYSREERTHCVIQGQPRPLNYFFEMVAALETADEYTAFHIRAHIGNHSLFLSGVFPERIRHRARRSGFPDMSYYQEMGRMNYKVASNHRLARRYDLAMIFETLSARFESTRLALNDLSERIFSLGDPETPAHQIFT